MDTLISADICHDIGNALFLILRASYLLPQSSAVLTSVKVLLASLIVLCIRRETLLLIFCLQSKSVTIMKFAEKEKKPWETNHHQSITFNTPSFLVNPATFPLPNISDTRISNFPVHHHQSHGRSEYSSDTDHYAPPKPNESVLSL